MSFCVIGSWCFIRERFIPVGILCLAASLAIKPQDTGLVWLYFLLAGRVYRKRALLTIGTTIVMSLPVVLWVWRVSPQWMQELHSNVMAFAVHGGLNDPAPASAGTHGLGMVISLQAVISVFWDNPHIYNPVSYLIVVPPLFGMDVRYRTVTSHSRQSMAGDCSNCGFLDAACLSSAIRCQTDHLDSSRLRHALG
ncbi:MAG: hypothetical protein P4L87_09610 [Formivibrio sp.]|nr:hypothetical protein [Formivibrio sp.]